MSQMEVNEDGGLRQIEFGIIANSLENPPSFFTSVPEDIVDLAKQLTCGNYRAALEDSLIQDVLLDILESRIGGTKLDSGPSEQLSLVRSLLGGVACLYAFLQANWTGPMAPWLDGFTPKWWRSIPHGQPLLSELEVNGEQPYALVARPELLFVASAVLVSSPAAKQLATGPWWAMRTMFVHQQLLENNAALLKDAVDACIADAAARVDAHAALVSSEVRAQLHLESGLVRLKYHNVAKAQEEFAAAQAATGLQTQLTGKLGKRTKHQTFQVSQLVLEASSRVGAEASSIPSFSPQSVALTDDVLLETPALEGSDVAAPLTVIDQAILLNLCNVVKSQSAKHTLTVEEMMAYVIRIQEKPQNWMVHSTCLLLRSRLEKEKMRTSDRAALQLQVLVEQYVDDEPSVAERMRYLLALPFPPRWLLKREVGETFLGLGAASSALQVFEELQLWEDVIDCYRALEQTKKAEEIVRRELAKRETPSLLCALADVTGDETAYERAWELSNHHYARAKRSLGLRCLRRQEWEKCIEHYREALEINPLYPHCWYSVGCAYMQLSRWEPALQCFSRVITQEPENGEAWNNLGSVYIKVGKRREAFSALQEALKYQRTNWRVWQNFLYLAMDAREFQLAINAMHELLELRDKEVDHKILQLLLVLVVKDMPDAHGRKGREYQKMVENLMNHIASKISSDHQIWLLYAQYHEGLGDKIRAIEFHEKRVRALQACSWESDTESYEMLANATVDLAEAYLSDESGKFLYDARTKVRGLLKKSEDTFGTTEPYKKLESTLERVMQREAAMKA
eukprot:TRINITY_DN8746_c0_g1_i1.p1 TRINITY_DN8746_c0_g1~~TRINITY_DN8746_c0_g1_i1.p1  ORF type:complete len:798 (+),score=187.39 TRINITY_DN8746_c0_g1_i1:56-2449(+)